MYHLNIISLKFDQIAEILRKRGISSFGIYTYNGVAYSRDEADGDLEIIYTTNFKLYKERIYTEPRLSLSSIGSYIRTYNQIESTQQILDKIIYHAIIVQWTELNLGTNIL
jgi:hypothetical protein